MDKHLLDILACPICKGKLDYRKAQQELGFRTLDQEPYLQLYRDARMDWKAAAAELTAKGFPAEVLARLHGFRAPG